jgi:Rv0078B-related antitoxin
MRSAELVAMNSRRPVVEIIDPMVADILRKKSPAERLAMAFDMWDLALGMIRANLQREHPEWTAAELQREVARRIQGRAEVLVRMDEDDTGDDADDPGTMQPGKRTIRWRGTVPPQKWMNFYTKLLARFASSPDLKLEVSFEVVVDSEQAKSKTDDTRSGLNELGLDDGVMGS